MKLPVKHRTLKYFSCLAAGINLLTGACPKTPAQGLPSTLIQTSETMAAKPTARFAVAAPLQPDALRQMALATSPFAAAGHDAGVDAGDRVANEASESRSLPEAPEPAPVLPAPRNTGNVAPLYTKDIPAGLQAQPLSSRDKVVLGLRDLYSFGNFGAMFLSTGYSHLTNGQPNFGTDRGAYGQRLGAAALRETSQGLLTDAVFAPLLHQDPRYYVLGPDHSIARRTLYAITRPLVSRTDSGRPTVNGSLLLGYGAAAVLTNAYYPAINRNAHDTLSTFGASIGGSALGAVVSEFADQLLVATHLRRAR